MVRAVEEETVVAALVHRLAKYSTVGAIVCIFAVVYVVLVVSKRE
jgi:hypothetical protein